MNKSQKIQVFFVFVALLWGIHLLDWLLPVNLNSFGIIPRTTRGLIGIAASPLLHANLFHLIGNTVPLLALGLILISFYDEVAFGVIGVIIVVGGSLVWILGRTANHIGASGVIYGIAAFLIAYGIIKKKILSILIAAIVVFVYGGSMVTGLLPFQSYISWEGHLFSAAAGVLAAYMYSQRPLKGDRNEYDSS
jgi:membrane associated rhomboid family serine protease